MRGGRAVDSAAHCHERAAVARLEPDRPVGGRAAERGVEGVGGEVGRVELARREAAELVGDLV